MRTKLMLAAVTAVMMAAPVAMAGEHGEAKHGGKMLEKIDTDADGKVSKAEFMTAHEARFTKADADADGFLTAEEMKAAWENMREKRRSANEESGSGTEGHVTGGEGDAAAE